MTGYGSGEYENELYRFKVEIKSVNHRYNNISIRMPYHINYLEEEVRKAIKKELKRGSVDVFINLEYIEQSAIDVKVDMALAKSYKSALDSLVEELGLGDNVRLNNIISMSDVITTERKDVDEDLVSECLNEALSIALSSIVEMRISEGRELKEDILDKIEKIEACLKIVETRSPSVVTEYKDRLHENIKNLIDDDIPLDEERLNNEVAYFADKCSIDEEVVRLKSHIKQFRDVLNESDAIGRKLDFLIQEINREINTIGSKANDVVISENVVNIKSELEKIREQVQNIE